MRVLHHLEQSRSFRILWALEELGVDYEVKFYKRLANFSAPPSLKAVHPLGKAPILSDGENTLAESAVILEYLQQKDDLEGKFKPSSQQDIQQYQYWMHYAEGSLMPLLVMQLVMTKVPEQAPWLIKPIAHKIADGVKGAFIKPRLSDHIQFIEKHLAQHDYFAGSFSFADIQMSFPLEALNSRMKGHYPNIHAFIQRIGQRKAYQQAKAKEQSLG